jgi:hypothetical protein
MFMKKIALLLLCSAILIGCASAYIITLSAPKTINAGETLKVNGTSNLPAGFSTEVTLSKVGSSVTLNRKQITIQDDGSFTCSFDTTSLEKGTYRLEIPKNSEYSYGSGSTSWLFFDVIDRRSELTVSSPLTQTFDGTLDVAGTISTVEDGGLKVEVQQGVTIIFGPEYISTTKGGAFDISIPIEAGGSYTVTLIDSTDYTWSIRYSVISPVPTSLVTTTTSEAPTTTTGIPGAPHATVTASRTQPAYFEVITNRGEVHAVTSGGVDWVIEYIDESGVLNKVNTRGTAAEEVRFASNGGTVYFKVYPDQFADQAPLTLSVENARSVTVCTTCQTLFGEVITTPATPLSLFIVLGALAVLVFVRRGT